MNTSVALRKAMRLRLRTTGMLAIDYGFSIGLLFAFALADIIAYHTPLILLAIAVALNFAFAGLIVSETTRRFQDTSMTAVQLWAACGVYLSGFLLAPQIAYVFAIYLFVPLSYGSVLFTQRMFLAAWILLFCATGAIILTMDVQTVPSLAMPIDCILFWTVTAFALDASWH